MEIQVKVTRILDAQRFNGKKDPTKEYVRYSFVGETQEQYSKTIKFDVNSQQSWDNMKIEVGGVFDVSFDVSSREWNGRFFTEVNAWKAVCVSGAKAGNVKDDAEQPVDNAPKNESGGGTDLPF
jgi:hypothetical protein